MNSISILENSVAENFQLSVTLFNYLTLEQWELARATLDQLFQRTPFRTCSLLHSLLLSSSQIAPHIQNPSKLSDYDTEIIHLFEWFPIQTDSNIPWNQLIAAQPLLLHFISQQYQHFLSSLQSSLQLFSLENTCEVSHQKAKQWMQKIKNDSSLLAHCIETFNDELLQLELLSKSILQQQQFSVLWDSFCSKEQAQQYLQQLQQLHRQSILLQQRSTSSKIFISSQSFSTIALDKKQHQLILSKELYEFLKQIWVNASAIGYQIWSTLQQYSCIVSWYHVPLSKCTCTIVMDMIEEEDAMTGCYLLRFLSSFDETNQEEKKRLQGLVTKLILSFETETAIDLQHLFFSSLIATKNIKLLQLVHQWQETLFLQNTNPQSTFLKNNSLLIHSIRVNHQHIFQNLLSIVLHPNTSFSFVKEILSIPQYEPLKPLLLLLSWPIKVLQEQEEKMAEEYIQFLSVTGNQPNSIMHQLCQEWIFNWQLAQWIHHQIETCYPLLHQNSKQKHPILNKYFSATSPSSNSSHLTRSEIWKLLHSPQHTISQLLLPWLPFLHWKAVYSQLQFTAPYYQQQQLILVLFYLLHYAIKWLLHMQSSSNSISFLEEMDYLFLQLPSKEWQSSAVQLCFKLLFLHSKHNKSILNSTSLLILESYLEWLQQKCNVLQHMLFEKIENLLWKCKFIKLYVSSPNTINLMEWMTCKMNIYFTIALKQNQLQCCDEIVTKFNLPQKYRIRLQQAQLLMPSQSIENYNTNTEYSKGFWFDYFLLKQNKEMQIETTVNDLTSVVQEWNQFFDTKSVSEYTVSHWRRWYVLQMEYHLQLFSNSLKDHLNTIEAQELILFSKQTSSTPSQQLFQFNFQNSTMFIKDTLLYWKGIIKILDIPSNVLLWSQSVEQWIMQLLLEKKQFAKAEQLAQYCQISLLPLLLQTCIGLLKQKRQSTTVIHPKKKSVSNISSSLSSVNSYIGSSLLQQQQQNSTVNNNNIFLNHPMELFFYIFQQSSLLATVASLFLQDKYHFQQEIVDHFLQKSNFISLNKWIHLRLKLMQSVVLVIQKWDQQANSSTNSINDEQSSVISKVSSSLPWEENHQSEEEIDEEENVITVEDEEDDIISLTSSSPNIITSPQQQQLDLSLSSHNEEWILPLLQQLQFLPWHSQDSQFYSHVLNLFLQHKSASSSLAPHMLYNAYSFALNHFNLLYQLPDYVLKMVLEKSQEKHNLWHIILLIKDKTMAQQLLCHFMELWELDVVIDLLFYFCQTHNTLFEKYIQCILIQQIMKQESLLWDKENSKIHWVEVDHFLKRDAKGFVELCLQKNLFTLAKKVWKCYLSTNQQLWIQILLQQLIKQLQQNNLHEMLDQFVKENSQVWMICLENLIQQFQQQQLSFECYYQICNFVLTRVEQEAAKKWEQRMICFGILHLTQDLSLQEYLFDPLSMINWLLEDAMEHIAVLVAIHQMMPQFVFDNRLLECGKQAWIQLWNPSLAKSLWDLTSDSAKQQVGLICLELCHEFSEDKYLNIITRQQSIVMMQQLVQYAKKCFLTIGNQQYLSICDTFLSQIQLLQSILLSNVKIQVTLKELNDASKACQLRDALIGQDAMELAIELCTLCQLPSQIVWQQWGFALLKIGSYEMARDKFQYCVKHHSYANFSMAQKQLLLNQILQILESAPSTTQLLFLMQSKTQRHTNQNLMSEKLMPLEQEDSKYFKEVTKYSNLDKKRYKEAKYYLKWLGNEQAMLNFLLRHGRVIEAAQYIFSSNSSQLFLDFLVPFCYQHGCVEDLIQYMLSTSTLDNTYWTHLCKFLSDNQVFYLLYKCQTVMKDELRAGLTCIKLFLKELIVEKKMVWLETAKKHLTTAFQQIQQQQYVEKKPILKLEDISKHIKMITLQMEITKTMLNVNLHTFLYPIKENDSNVYQIVPIQPLQQWSLFDSLKKRCELVEICLMNHWFDLGFKVMNEFQLPANKLYTKTLSQMARKKQFPSMFDLFKFIKSMPLISEEELDDMVLQGCVKVLTNEMKEWKQAEKWVPKLSSTKSQIIACLWCQKLKSAYLLAVNSKDMEQQTINDQVTFVLKYCTNHCNLTENKNASSVVEMCKQYLSKYQ